MRSDLLDRMSPLLWSSLLAVLLAAHASWLAPVSWPCMPASARVLEFRGDLQVNTKTSGDQRTPAIASNLEGMGIYLVWEDEGTVVLSISLLETRGPRRLPWRRAAASSIPPSRCASRWSRTRRTWSRRKWSSSPWKRPGAFNSLKLTRAGGSSSR
jgi:hypothetical protein